MSKGYLTLLINKMNRKRIAQYCCAALVAAGIGLNIQNAIADYGIGENSLSLVAGPGSNSGSNSNSNYNSNSNWDSNVDVRPEVRYDCQDVVSYEEQDDQELKVLFTDLYTTPPNDALWCGYIYDEGIIVGDIYLVHYTWVYGCNICEMKPYVGKYTDWKCENNCTGPFKYKK